MIFCILQMKWFISALQISNLKIKIKQNVVSPIEFLNFRACFKHDIDVLQHALLEHASVPQRHLNARKRHVL
jgi:hypothetical protein